jgi:hypothetical protein
MSAGSAGSGVPGATPQDLYTQTYYPGPQYLGLPPYTSALVSPTF